MKKLMVIIGIATEVCVCRACVGVQGEAGCEARSRGERPVCRRDGKGHARTVERDDARTAQGGDGEVEGRERDQPREG